jgi:ABC-type dipeptide/oligopeptide/nickel transport system ATPase component
LRQGRVVECGPTGQLFRDPRTEDTRALLNAVLRNSSAAADLIADPPAAARR